MMEVHFILYKHMEIILKVNQITHKPNFTRPSRFPRPLRSYDIQLLHYNLLLIGFFVEYEVVGGGNILDFMKYLLAITNLKVMVECSMYFTSFTLYMSSTYPSH